MGSVKKVTRNMSEFENKWALLQRDLGKLNTQWKTVGPIMKDITATYQQNKDAKQREERNAHKK